MRHWETQIIGYPMSEVIKIIRDYEMKNELRILPLRKYEVLFNEGLYGEATDVFTADYHTMKDGRNLFYRTGNVIREYQVPLKRIVATPVDDDTEVPE
jgi:hypothetical protein